MQLQPQVSYFQSPLLMYTAEVVETSQLPSTERLIAAKDCYKRMEPLMRRLLLPHNYTNRKAQRIVSQGTGNAEDNVEGLQRPRRQFTLFDDNCLMIGLQKFGLKNVEAIKRHWLPQKAVSEIKNRVKNLTCSRVPQNQIKQWKQTHGVPLIDSEIKVLGAALRWFGPQTNRWHIIS